MMSRFGAWLAHLPTHTKVLLTFAICVVLIELAFRRFAPHSKAYSRWTKGIEAVGAVWTAVLLSIFLIALVLMHSGRDTGFGGLGFTPASQGGQHIVERNLTRLTVIVALVFAANTIALFYQFD